jgi:nitroreductase
MNQTLIEALNKRYATKLFDNTKIISPKNLETIIEAARLTPTSYGLQLMKIVVVKNPVIRQNLLEHSYNQKQIVDASHLLVLCTHSSFNTKHIDDYINNIAKTRAQDSNSKQLQGFKQMLEGFRQNSNSEKLEKWMKNQQHIVLGNLLTCCALLDIDACPMEGFVPHKYDEILELEKENLKSVLVVPIGYASENDKYKTLKKVRLATSDFVIYK